MLFLNSDYLFLANIYFNSFIYFHGNVHGPYVTPSWFFGDSTLILWLNILHCNVIVKILYWFESKEKKCFLFTGLSSWFMKKVHSSLSGKYFYTFWKTLPWTSTPKSWFAPEILLCKYFQHSTLLRIFRQC